MDARLLQEDANERGGDGSSPVLFVLAISRGDEPAPFLESAVITDASDRIAGGHAGLGR